MEAIKSVKKSAKRVVKILNCLIVFLPLLLAICLGIVYLFGGCETLIEGHTLEFYFLKKISFSFLLVILVLLWIAAVVGTTYILSLFSKVSNNQLIKNVLLLFLLFAITVGIRHMLIFIYKEDFLPFSDFESSWELAKGNFISGRLDYYSLFPAYLNFSVYENFIIRIFGESFVNVLWLNAVYCGISTSFIYLISREIINNEKVCIFAAVLYALYPSNILYIATATPEFITILFNTIGVFSLVKAIKNEKIISQIIWSIIGGIFLGLGGSFKTYSVVMIVAFAIVVFCIRPFYSSNCGKNKIIINFLLLIMILGGYKYSTTLLMNVSAEYFDIELSAEKATPHYLLVGLNTESEGQIQVGTLSRLYIKYYLDNGANYEAAKDYAYNILLNDWKNNTKKIIPNLGKKMIWAWQDDYRPINYFLNNVGVNPDTFMEEFVFTIVEQYGAGVGQIAYLTVLVLAFWGAISYSKKRDVNIIYEFMVLIILGYFGMIFLAEGQSRYKCLVMPYIMIFSGLGVKELLNIFDNKFQYKKVKGS